MALSQKKITELYNAIREPIMKERIAIRKSKNIIGQKYADNIDEGFFKLEQKIWREVKAVFKIP